MIKIYQSIDSKLYPLDISSAYFKVKNAFSIPIKSVKYGLQEIWTLIRSCFGSGFWRNEYKWVNSETWKN